MTTRTIFVISAGLSQPSSTRLLADRLAAATARHLPGEIQVSTIELRELAHDITSDLLTGFCSPALCRAIDQLHRADGLIAVTPLYRGTYNALFKSFFDVLDSDTLAGACICWRLPEGAQARRPGGEGTSPAAAWQPADYLRPSGVLRCH
jgi:FMN reductase